MTQSVLVRCKGTCRSEVSSAEVDAEGVCSLCQIMWKVKDHFEEYKRLWAKRTRYARTGAPYQATEKQLGRVVGRIAGVCHTKLPTHGAIRLVNEICESARAEVEGYQRVLTVKQALLPEKKPQKKATTGRRTASGLYIPG